VYSCSGKKIRTGFDLSDRTERSRRNLNSNSEDVKVCDDGTLVHILCFWTLSVVLSLSKISSCLFFKTQRFGDWILSPFSGKTYSGGPNRLSKSLSPEIGEQNPVSEALFSDKDRTMDNVQKKHNICIALIGLRSFKCYIFPSAWWPHNLAHRLLEFANHIYLKMYIPVSGRYSIHFPNHIIGYRCGISPVKLSVSVNDY
jgi:hypothetical protein